MKLNGIAALFTARATTGTSEVLADTDFRAADQVRDKLLLEVASSGGTFSLQPQVSIDGTTWYGLGSAITTAGLTVLTMEAPFFRVNLSAVSGGTVTVRAR